MQATRTAVLPGVEVAHASAGSGSPALLFVHGFACAKEDWQGQFDHLSASHRCVALDLPGHGESTRVQACSMPQLAQAVNAVRAEAAPGPVVLVGHSLGVRIIIDAYLAAPQGVAGIVLVDGRFYDGDPQEIAPRIAALVDGPGFDEFARSSFTSMFTSAPTRPSATAWWPARAGWTRCSAAACCSSPSSGTRRAAATRCAASRCRCCTCSRRTSTPAAA